MFRFRIAGFRFGICDSVLVLIRMVLVPCVVPVVAAAAVSCGGFATMLVPLIVTVVGVPVNVAIGDALVPIGRI